MSISKKNEKNLDYNLTKKDLEIFLTGWEVDFLYTIKYEIDSKKRITAIQRNKLKEIENKLQEIEDDIKKKICDGSIKVVNSSIKTRSVNLSYFINLPKTDLRFTILTEQQRDAIIKIKKYWKTRVKNSKNWKAQKHWGYKQETISARINENLFNRLKNVNINKIIQNFIRKFLRDPDFRELFLEKLHEQFIRDVSDPVDSVDLTSWFESLLHMFPKVVSGKVYTIEKELFTFYFTFLNSFSVSYAVRCALIHYQNLENQIEIKKDEVISLQENLITGYKKEE